MIQCLEFTRNVIDLNFTSLYRYLPIIIYINNIGIMKSFGIYFCNYDFGHLLSTHDMQFQQLFLYFLLLLISISIIIVFIILYIFSYLCYFSLEIR